MAIYSEQLRSALSSIGNADGLLWLDSVCHKLRQSQEPENDLCTFSAMALRKLSNKQLNDETRQINTPHGTLQIATWDAGTIARSILILEAAQTWPAESTALINAVFRYGDENERASIVRGLILFPHAEALKSIALEAGRINSRFFYTALTEHNPYPAAFYTEHEFNQLVMKSLFMGIGIGTIYDLAQRTNLELSRMCEDYIDERLDAKRSVPEDIWLAARPFLSARGKQQMEQLAENDPRHKNYISSMGI